MNNITHITLLKVSNRKNRKFTCIFILISRIVCMRKIEQVLTSLLDLDILKVKCIDSEVKVVVSQKGLLAHLLMNNLLDDRQIEFLNKNTFIPSSSLQLKEVE